MDSVRRSMVQIEGGGRVLSSYRAGNANRISEGGKSNRETEGLRSSASLSSDKVELSMDRSQPVPGTVISDYLHTLAQDFPGVSLLIKQTGEEMGAGIGTEELKRLAAELGNGKYVMISQEFLERMGKNGEEFDRCAAILTGMMRRLTAGNDSEGGNESGSRISAGRGVWLGGDRAVFWSLPESSGNDFLKKMAEKSSCAGAGIPEAAVLHGMPEKGQKTSGTDFRKPVTVSCASMGHYSGLARASSKGEVKKVMGDIHRSIGNLRLASCFGDEKERLKARQALNSLQKLLARGNRKIKKLEEEELLGIRKKRAEKARKEKRVRQIKLELKKRRSARLRADSRLVQEGISDTYMIFGDWRNRNDYEAELPGAGSDFMTGAAGGTDIGTGTGAGAGDGFSAADVAITAEMVF